MVTLARLLCMCVIGWRAAVDTMCSIGGTGATILCTCSSRAVPFSDGVSCGPKRWGWRFLAVAGPPLMVAAKCAGETHPVVMGGAEGSRRPSVPRIAMSRAACAALRRGIRRAVATLRPQGRSEGAKRFVAISCFSFRWGGGGTPNRGSPTAVGNRWSTDGGYRTTVTRGFFGGGGGWGVRDTSARYNTAPSHRLFQTVCCVRHPCGGPSLNAQARFVGRTRPFLQPRRMRVGPPRKCPQPF